jgi:hypothetical protein
LLSGGVGGARWPGSTKFIDNLVEGLDKQPSYLLNATQCLPLEPAIRSMTGTYLQGVKSEDLVYRRRQLAAPSAASGSL